MSTTNKPKVGERVKTPIGWGEFIGFRNDIYTVSVKNPYDPERPKKKIASCCLYFNRGQYEYIRKMTISLDKQSVTEH